MKLRLAPILFLIMLLATDCAFAQKLSWSDVDVLSVAGQSVEDTRISISADGTMATAVWRRRINVTDWIVQTASATISDLGTATWGSVSTLSMAGEDSVYPEVSLSADGTMATVVWQNDDGLEEIIQSVSATISGNTATWGTVTDISLGSSICRYPIIGLSADGTKATAVWRRSNGSEDIVQTASATISGNTATWGAVIDLSAVGETARDPQVAVSSDGMRATAVWKRFNGSNDIAQSASATISGNTATWSSVTDLSATGENATNPRISLSSDGTKATAIWVEEQGFDSYVQTASATISGNTAMWSAVFDLTPPGDDARAAKVSLSSDGTMATAVWYRSSGSIQSTSATISGNTATWSSISTLFSPLGGTSSPYLSLSSDGTRATAIWVRNDGSNFIAQVASAMISGNAATWGSATDLSPAGQDASSVRVALSADGTECAAIWERATDSSDKFVQSSIGVEDLCSSDPDKRYPGMCGCGVADTDTDQDGTADCNDECDEDPGKNEEGICGCGSPDEDADGDGLLDCFSDPGATPPAPSEPTTPAEGESLASRAKKLANLMKRKVSADVLASLRANLMNIQDAFAAALESDNFDTKQQKAIRSFVKKIKKLQKGKTKGAKWKRKKKAAKKAIKKLVQLLRRRNAIG